VDRSTRPERDANKNWYPDHVVYNATRDQLKAMPQSSTETEKGAPLRYTAPGAERRLRKPAAAPLSKSRWTWHKPAQRKAVMDAVPIVAIAQISQWSALALCADSLHKLLLRPRAVCAFALRATLVVSERGLSTLRPLLSFLLWHRFLDGLLSLSSNRLGGLHNALRNCFLLCFLSHQVFL
jgi:hypothetical protein